MHGAPDGVQNIDGAYAEVSGDRAASRDVLEAGYLLPRDAATLQDVVNALGSQPVRLTGATPNSWVQCCSRSRC